MDEVTRDKTSRRAQLCAPFSDLGKLFCGQLCLGVAALTVLPLAVSRIHWQTLIAFSYAIVIVALAGAGASGSIAFFPKRCCFRSLRSLAMTIRGLKGVNIVPQKRG